MTRHSRRRGTRLATLVLMGLLLAGCGGPGLLGSGLYRTSIGGPMAQRGMSYADVETVMGPSWQQAANTTGVARWRYGINLFGMIGPTCNVGRGADLSCIDVYFYEGRVADVVIY